MASDYKLSTLVLVGGVLRAGYKYGDTTYEAQICNILNSGKGHEGWTFPRALVTTHKSKLDLLDTKVSIPFSTHDHLDMKQFYVVTKVREDKKTNLLEGKEKGTDQWLPILKTKDGVLYVQCGRFKRKLVILEHDRPFTSLEKAGIGLGIGLGVVGSAVAAIATFPLAVAGMGFGAGGIAAGSTAAGMMSAGIIGVATLQSIGAAGMGVASTIIMGGIGAGVGAGVGAATLLAANQSGPKSLHSQVPNTLGQNDNPLVTYNMLDGSQMTAIVFRQNEERLSMPSVDAILGHSFVFRIWYFLGRWACWE